MGAEQVPVVSAPESIVKVAPSTVEWV